MTPERKDRERSALLALPLSRRSEKVREHEKGREPEREGSERETKRSDRGREEWERQSETENYTRHASMFFTRQTCEGLCPRQILFTTILD